MTRFYARAPRGERVYGEVPRNRGKNTTLLVGEHDVRRHGAVPSGGGRHDEGGLRDLRGEQVLAPSLRPRQVVVLDNLSSHKGDRVRQLIEGRGCSLLFLPPYSPDFSPIEEAFSKIKALLKKSAARTRGALLGAIGQAISAVTLEDVVGYFGHCGYLPAAQPS
jgi:DDE superfamily endonuclease